MKKESAVGVKVGVSGVEMMGVLVAVGTRMGVGVKYSNVGTSGKFVFFEGPKTLKMTVVMVQSIATTARMAMVTLKNLERFVFIHHAHFLLELA